MLSSVVQILSAMPEIPTSGLCPSRNVGSSRERDGRGNAPPLQLEIRNKNGIRSFRFLGEAFQIV